MAPSSVENRCAGCLRPAHKECSRKMCFTCCSAASMDGCEIHALTRAKKQEEERILAAAVQNATSNKGNTRKSTSGRFKHHEEKFNSYNQTVVIWCLRDFLRNGKHSDDSIGAELKALRQRELNRRRGVFAGRSSADGAPGRGKRGVARPGRKSALGGKAV